MKKLLLIAALVGSVNGTEIDVTNWNELKSHCSEDLTDPIFTGGVYTLGEGETYNWIWVSSYEDFSSQYFEGVSNENSIPESTKLIIPKETTFKISEHYDEESEKYYSSLFLKNRVAIENNGSFINEGVLLTIENAEVTFINNSDFKNENMICTVNSNSHLTFLGSGDINSEAGIYTYVSDMENISKYSGSSITFSGSGKIISDDGGIGAYCPESIITFSGPRDIFVFIFIIGHSKLIFSSAGDILCRGSISIDSQPNSQSSLIISKGTNLIFDDDMELIQDKLDESATIIGSGSIDIEGKLIIQRTGTSYYPGITLISGITGSGTLDISGIIDCDMSDDNNGTEKGCIDISAEAFSNKNPFRGTIKLPINTKCKTLDLSNVSKAKIFYGDSIVAPYLGPNMENRIIFQKPSISEELRSDR